MALEDILSKKIIYCLPHSTVQEVAQAMKEEGVGAVLVVEEGLPKGIITDRDIVLRSVSSALDPKATRADAIMTKGVETVTLRHGLYAVAERMKEAQVRRVAVVDDGGNAVGLLSFDDVFDLLAEELNHLRAAISPKRPKLATRAA